MIVYDKEKEICASHNKDFLSYVSQPQSLVNYFIGKTRFEVTLDTPPKIMSYLNLTDTKVYSVLNAKANPILYQYDKIFSSTKLVSETSKFNNYEDWSMKVLIEAYNGDLKRLEQEIRDKYPSRSGALKRMKKIEAIYYTMTSASTSENLIETVRNLLF